MDLPVSASPVMGMPVCITTPGFKWMLGTEFRFSLFTQEAISLVHQLGLHVEVLPPDSSHHFHELSILSLVNHWCITKVGSHITESYIDFEGCKN